MELSADQVLGVVSGEPAKVGELGLRILARAQSSARQPAGQPIGQFLAEQGISLSALQQLLDGLVRDGQVLELRGRALWDSYFPGLPANAKGRYYLTP